MKRKFMTIKSFIVKTSLVGLVATTLFIGENSAFAEEDNNGNAYGQNEIWGEGLFDNLYYNMNVAINPFLKQESNDVRTAIYYTTTEDGNRVPSTVVVMGWNWTGNISEKFLGFNDDPDCWATENGTGVNEQQLNQIQHALEKETGLKLKVGLNYITNHFNGHNDTELRLVFNVVQ
ncbi:hypothetical protein QUF94_22800 [Peribacillus sp. NJ4]|uniref:hypothetical protein n=1 Tax=Peribacillus sp. NJ4 TaxID=3055862 RepID=UPI0025A2E34B|nr:hypothetical protein [Peribacillus sp. NJ4]MDM5214231.1 hypothetical protein [Peribacillus sp. NJ4]